MTPRGIMTPPSPSPSFTMSDRLPRSRRPRDPERGSMLLLGLMVILLMIVLVTDATQVSRLEHDASRNSIDNLRLEWALNGGFEVAKSHLAQDLLDTDIDSLQESWCSIPEELLAVPQEEGTSSKEPDIRLRIEIEDEDRKWPLGLLVVENEAAQRRRKDGLTAVIDWFREGTPYDIGSGDAETYATAIWTFMKRRKEEASGPVPRAPTKSDLHLMSVGDLALVQDLPDSLLYDRIVSDTAGNPTVVPGLLRFVSIHSELQVNVNTAPEAVLRGLFRREDWGVGSDIFRAREDQSEDKKKELAEEQDRRAANPNATSEEDPDRNGGAVFEKIEDLQKIPTMVTRVWNEARASMSVTSKVFSIWVTAEIGGEDTSKSEKTRRWIVRRDNGKFTLVLTEAIDLDFRPRFRTREEIDEASGAAIDGGTGRTSATPRTNTPRTNTPR